MSPICGHYYPAYSLYLHLYPRGGRGGAGAMVHLDGGEVGWVAGIGMVVNPWEQGVG